MAAAVKYGKNFPSKEARMPVVFRQVTLDPAVIEYLENCPVFASEAKLRRAGFQKNIDHPTRPDHMYFEGYFHAVRNKRDTLLSMNPRWGTEFDKPAAPIELAAFIEAFRRCNSASIEGALRAGLEARAASSPAVATLLEFVNDGMMFADLAVQVHYGQEIAADHVSYHVDACNSILHMGISVHGARALHTYLSNTPDDEAQHDVAWERRGDVYITSPYAFRHGVEYPEATFEDKVIAIQCRWPLTLDAYTRMMACVDSWPQMQEAVNEMLLQADISVPSLQQVLQVSRELEPPSILSRIMQKFKT